MTPAEMLREFELKLSREAFTRVVGILESIWSAHPRKTELDLCDHATCIYELLDCELQQMFSEYLEAESHVLWLLVCLG